MRPSHATCSPCALRATQAGFTLIEVLVVLILVGMISGVLFQALERAFSLQVRFGSELFKTQQGQMATDWYRQAVQGLYPDQPDGPQLFRGTATEFSGLTTNPLGLDYGAPTAVTWRLEKADDGLWQLRYTEAGPPSNILQWQGKAAKFVYIDAQQEPHDQWPPPLGLFPQLPKQIELVADDLGESIVIIAAPQGPAEPILRAQDLFKFIP